MPVPWYPEERQSETKVSVHTPDAASQHAPEGAQGLGVQDVPTPMKRLVPVQRSFWISVQVPEVVQQAPIWQGCCVQVVK